MGPSIVPRRSMCMSRRVVSVLVAGVAVVGWSGSAQAGPRAVVTAKMSAFSTSDVVDFDVADINGDSDPDVVGVVSDGSAYSLWRFLGTDRGGLLPGADLGGAFRNVVAVRLRDWDGDGRPDLIMAQG